MFSWSHFCGEPTLENNQYFNYEHRYPIYTWSDTAFKGTVVNRALSSLHGGSLEFTLTVPLTFFFATMWKISSFFYLKNSLNFIPFCRRNPPISYEKERLKIINFQSEILTPTKIKTDVNRLYLAALSMERNEVTSIQLNINVFK